jgi:predicted dehydrogenase
VAVEHGVFLEYGTHLVDMIRALLRDPTRVYARMHHFGSSMRGENQALAVYEYPETTAIVNIAWQPAGPPFGSFLVEGDCGVAYYEGTMTRGTSSRFRVMQGATVIIDESRSTYQDYVDSFYAFERECVECMLTGKPVTQSGVENLKTLASTFAAYASAQHGGVVEIAPYLSR